MMNFSLFGWNKTELKSSEPSKPLGDVANVASQEDGVFKTYINNFLYKPPFGYPRNEPLQLIRETAKNPYVYSIIKTICDEVASAEWNIKPKEGVEMTPELEKKKKEIENFFANPNGNRESFSHILRAATKDLLEIDSGVMVKVFSQEGKMVQLFARDGATFLKNPDIYGYLGNRADIIEPAAIKEFDNYGQQEIMKYYELTYGTQAAYFQYGGNSAAMPVPYGKREIVYMMQNPRTDSIYGVSPVAVLSDLIYTLVYGSKYNLDFYMNNNMPEGFMSIIGANQQQLNAAKERFESQFRVKDPVTGFMRKIGFKVPFTSYEVKFTPFQLDPKTMQVIEQQQWFTKIVWASFGVTPDEMGFTENSNRAVSETQHKIAQRKASRPIFRLFEYHINQEIIPEFETTDLEFCFDQYNVEDEIRKYDLYQRQLSVGVMTPEMIADKEGIDVKELQKYKDAQMQKQMQMQNQAQTSQNPQNQQNSPDSKMSNLASDTKAKIVILTDEDAEKATKEFEVGNKVKVVKGTKSYLDQVGTIEEVRGDGVYVVRFDVGVDVFNVEQLTLVEGKTKPLRNIKSKDPFNNTELEKQIMSDIKESQKKLKEALKQLQ